MPLNKSPFPMPLNAGAPQSPQRQAGVPGQAQVPSAPPPPLGAAAPPPPAGAGGDALGALAGLRGRLGGQGTDPGPGLGLSPSANVGGQGQLQEMVAQQLRQLLGGGGDNFGGGGGLV